MAFSTSRQVWLCPNCYEEDKEYNGWKNYVTWNVMLWINNDYTLYKAACEFMKNYKGCTPYAHFISAMGLEDERTLDNIEWLGSRLCYRELNEAMWELKGDN